MSIKWIGAVLVVVGCGGCGFAMAAAKRREERELRQLLRALEYMECELQYHQTPLPQLCRMASAATGGSIGQLFLKLGENLDQNAEPEALGCMELVLAEYTMLSQSARKVLRDLGECMGCFDLPGQLRGFQSARKEGLRLAEELAQNRDSRLRSYQTLGLCAGAALAIILL